MLSTSPTQRRRREVIVIVSLTVLCAAAMFFFAWLVLGGWFLALLATAAGVFLLGCVNYLLWGRSMTRAHGPRPPEFGRVPRRWYPRR
jgi:hypothetical protein